MVLQPEEVLLLCTDGLLVSGGRDRQAGWARVREELGRHPTHHLGLLADALLEGVHVPPERPSRAPPTERREDDIALVLLRRQEPGRGLRRTALSIDQAEPARIGEARHQVADLLHDWEDTEQAEGAVLMCSEMLANVLMHTDSDALLVAELHGERGERLLRVEVSDNSAELPHRREPGELASSGRGLLLMESLADHWGVDPRGEGKSTWFELYENPEEARKGSSQDTAPAGALS